MYNIIAIMGQSGAGKDSMLQSALTAIGTQEGLHEIIPCTTRPKREGDKDGVNYYFYLSSEFEEKLLHDEILEFARFNNWWYGTSYESVKEDKLNVGVFNPFGVRQLLDNPECNVTVFWVQAAGKNRLLRQLNREESPDVDEIVRRYSADKEDFKDIDFDYISIPNETCDDFWSGVRTITSFIERSLAQGQT